MSPDAVSIVNTDSSVFTTTRFSVHALAEPGVLPRLLELFAKRGLVPEFCRSTASGSGVSELTIGIRKRGLDAGTADHIAASMRQIPSVRVVLTARMRERRRASNPPRRTEPRTLDSKAF